MVSIRSHATRGTSGSSNTVLADIPGGGDAPQAGDQIFIFMAFGRSNDVDSVDLGFTVQDSSSDAGTHRAAILYKVADGTEGGETVEIVMDGTQSRGWNTVTVVVEGGDVAGTNFSSEGFNNTDVVVDEAGSLVVTGIGCSATEPGIPSGTTLLARSNVTSASDTNHVSVAYEEGVNPDTHNYAWSDQGNNARMWAVSVAPGVGTYDLTINISGEGAVTPDPEGPYIQGEDVEVELAPTPASGWEFDDPLWTGADVPEGNENDDPLVLTMDDDKTVTANFAEIVPDHIRVIGGSRTGILTDG